MIRKMLAAATLALFGLLWLPTMASAATPPYPAPPVTPETSIPAVADVVSTAPAGDSVSSLASTGAGFNVGLTLIMAAAVLVVGAGLLLVGRRSGRTGAGR